MNSRNKNISLLMLLLFAHAVFAEKEFEIDPIGQDSSLWCWATCCEMIFDAYRLEEYGSYGYVDQYDIADWAVDGNNETNNLSGDDNSVDEVLSHFGSIISNYTEDPPGANQGNISRSDLSHEIDVGRPLIAQVFIDDEENEYYHDVLIRGYTGPSGSSMEDVLYNDPDGGERRMSSYAMFVKTGTSWEWFETLRLTTNPRYAIPTGFYDYVRISDDGTTTVTPSTTSLSYEANFHTTGMPPSHPVSWNWKLIFVHSGGDCIARSWTSTSTASELTWNISNFYLPTGYQWIYNYQGKIPGRVELDLLDSDGCHHLDAINVIYVPSSLYPRYVVYEDHTVSGCRRALQFPPEWALQNPPLVKIY